MLCSHNQAHQKTLSQSCLHQSEIRLLQNIIRLQQGKRQSCCILHRTNHSVTFYLIQDDEFNVDNFMTFHLSISSDVPEQPSPLAYVLEQGTPLTNDLSERTKQVWSRQLQKNNVQHTENTTKQQSLDEQGLHAELASAVSTSSKIAPVNLEMNFAAEKLEETNVRSDSPDSPFDSNEGIDKAPHDTHKAKVSIKYKMFG